MIILIVTGYLQPCAWEATVYGAAKEFDMT